MHVSISDISFSGTKDKRGITLQRIRLKNLKEEYIFKFKHKLINLGGIIEYKDK